MKPFEMSPGSGAAAPASTTEPGQPWDREGKGAPAPAPAQVATPRQGNSGSLTRDELQEYLQFSQRNALARVNAQNFEAAMMHELRLDFAERRLKRQG